jgi:hypothetical protein
MMEFVHFFARWWSFEKCSIVTVYHLAHSAAQPLGFCELGTVRSRAHRA